MEFRLWANLKVKRSTLIYSSPLQCLCGMNERSVGWNTLCDKSSRPDGRPTDL